GYSVQYIKYVDQTLADKQRFAAVLRVFRPNGAVRELVPEKNFHWNVEQWVSEVAVWSRPAEDFYVILAGLSSDGTATFQILREPLMLWMWIGGGVMVLGTLLAWWPAGERRRAAAGTATG
ncbi:MAG: cytochrome c-type biogenesis CcmF C-terminal domain-containing protein, partial [Anaerolineae bacterium]